MLTWVIARNMALPRGDTLRGGVGLLQDHSEERAGLSESLHKAGDTAALDRARALPAPSWH